MLITKLTGDWCLDSAPELRSPPAYYLKLHHGQGEPGLLLVKRLVRRAYKHWQPAQIFFRYVDIIWNLMSVWSSHTFLFISIFGFTFCLLKGWCCKRQTLANVCTNSWQSLCSCSAAALRCFYPSSDSFNISEMSNVRWIVWDNHKMAWIENKIATRNWNNLHYGNKINLYEHRASLCKQHTTEIRHQSS